MNDLMQCNETFVWTQRQTHCAFEKTHFPRFSTRRVTTQTGVTVYISWSGWRTPFKIPVSEGFPSRLSSHFVGHPRGIVSRLAMGITWGNEHPVLVIAVHLVGALKEHLVVFLEKLYAAVVAQCRSAAEVHDVPLRPVVISGVDDENGRGDVWVGVLGKETLPFHAAFGE